MGDSMEAKIPDEIKSRTSVETGLNKALQEIPAEGVQMDEAQEKVVQLIIKIYSFVRQSISGQVKLFVESFYKTPLLKIEDDMTQIELKEADQTHYQEEQERTQKAIVEIEADVSDIAKLLQRMDKFITESKSRTSRRN